jgi:chaperonin cofactor prefoldin
MQQNRKMEDDKDATIRELRETVEILELKVKKLEQLVRLKDQKLAALQQRVNTFSS